MFKFTVIEGFEYEIDVDGQHVELTVCRGELVDQNVVSTVTFPGPVEVLDQQTGDQVAEFAPGVGLGASITAGAFDPWLVAVSFDEPAVDVST